MLKFQKINKFFAPPVFDDEANTYKAALVNSMIWLTLAPVPILVFLVWRFTPYYPIYWMIFLLKTLALGTFLVFLRRGFVRLAGIGLLGVVWIEFFFYAVLAGGIRTPAMNAMVLLVLAAGIVLGARESFMLAGTSVLAGAFLGLVEYWQLLPPGYIENSLIFAWSGLVINFSFGAVLLYMMINSGERALRDTHRAAEALAKANRSLQVSEANYRQLMEQAADSIFIIQADLSLSVGMLSNGLFVDVNSLGMELLGYSRDEILQMKMKDIVLLEDFENLKAAFETLCAGQTILIERQLRHRDGHLIPAEVSARVLADGRLQAIVRDISERKQREAERQTEFARFRALVDNASDAFFWHDDNGRILEVNRQACESLGYTREELIGMDAFKLDAGIDLAFYESIREQLADGNMLAFESFHRRKDGSMFPVEVRLRTYVDQGENIGLSLARDITERKNIDKERQENLHFLENLDRINRAFQGTNDLYQMLREVLEVVLDIFGSDRAWVFFPCDPDAPNWSVPMECTRPEYPGVYAKNIVLSNIPEMSRLLKIVLEEEGPVQFGPDAAYPVPLPLHTEFQVQSGIAVAIYPKTARPYMFGLHQCSSKRLWSSREVMLFQEIGRRMEEALSSMLVYQDLQDSERRLEAAQQLARVGYWELDLAEGTVTLSPVAYEILGISPDTGNLSLVEWTEMWEKVIVPESSESMLQGLMGTVQSGRPFSLEYSILFPDGTEHFMYSRGELIQDTQGISLQIFGMTQDITQLRRAQRALEERETLYRALFEQSSDGVVIHRAITGEAITANQAMADMMECEIADIIGTGMTEGVIPEDQADTQAKWQQIIVDGHLEPYERRLITRKGNLRYFEIAASTIYDSHTDTPRFIQAVLRDITERKQTETQIQAALQEKEILLKEIHHRVKNNLQVISSLLYLQSIKIEDESMLELFRESRNRVSAMALVHEQLYQSENFARVDFGTYLRALVGSLFESYGATEGEIKLSIETDGATLDVHTAIPCGLLVSEMVSNALKYAFPNGYGLIGITLFSNADGYLLRVSDDGVGLPEASAIRSGALGMQLIDRLVAQLGGKLSLSGPPGTAYTIWFP